MCSAKASPERFPAIANRNLRQQARRRLHIGFTDAYVIDSELAKTRVRGGLFVQMLRFFLKPRWLAAYPSARRVSNFSKIGPLAFPSQELANRGRGVSSPRQP